MTELVIMMWSMQDDIKTLLPKCGTRQEILADAQRVEPNLDLFAVHRWHQRNSVPAKYLLAIAKGASDRGKKVTVEQLLSARTGTPSADRGAA